MGIRIIRKMDSLGRIVIPKDVRDSLEIGAANKIEITVEDNAVILRKATEKVAGSVTKRVTPEVTNIDCDS